MAIAALQGLLERASLAATGRCAAALATDAAALADLSDWDEPPPRVQDGALLLAYVCTLTVSLPGWCRCKSA